MIYYDNVHNIYIYVCVILYCMIFHYMIFYDDVWYCWYMYLYVYVFLLYTLLYVFFYLLCTPVLLCSLIVDSYLCRYCILCIWHNYILDCDIYIYIVIAYYCRYVVTTCHYHLFFLFYSLYYCQLWYIVPYYDILWYIIITIITYRQTCFCCIYKCIYIHGHMYVYIHMQDGLCESISQSCTILAYFCSMPS